MTQITKCIIPAAGFGTRFLPATKAQPKEMLPIVDKPVIQYLVEEAVASGIKDIIIITGRGKRSIEDHFDASFELEKTLVEKGKTKELALVESISNLANIAYVRQPLPRGDWDAILRAKHFMWNEPFLVLFGDDLVDGEVPAAMQLIEAYQRKNSTVIALEKVSDDKVSSYWIIEAKDSDNKLHTVNKFLEKPKASETTSRLGVIGKYVLSPDIFDYLEKAPAGKDWEIRLADAFELMRQEKDIYGLEIEWTRYDTGDKLGFLKASIDFALKRDDLGEDLKEFLKAKSL
jgi:UTP--glucose-1-phosphate uridylyltransferase